MPRIVHLQDGVPTVIAVSGGADSVYLLERCRKVSSKVVVGHYNHRARGRASDADQRLVETLCREWMLPLDVETAPVEFPGSRRGRSAGGAPARFEEDARNARYAFLKQLRDRHGAARILVAHTADDQVETVLMRIFEGAGISGLKGIPRRTAEGVERPLLDTWREEILAYLRRHKVSYRTDKSNFDTRFERNWIRHVLIPLLEKRYGGAAKKRIFALGERFREIDEFLEASTRRWMKRNVRAGTGHDGREFRLPRTRYAKLPAAARKKIVQVVCFEGLAIAPNERLIETLDRVILAGKPSARLDLGNRASLSCRYAEAIFRSRPPGDAGGERRARPDQLVVRETARRPTAGGLRRMTAGERGAAFDADMVSTPFSVRPLRAGDRIIPFGAAAGKKVKEVMIDRKVPRGERWGRPVVCDAMGAIVWIPGVVRSSMAPVTADTRRTAVLTMRPPAST